ncbi:MAG: class I SAM-dependent methyltransferase [Planctomycetota bacterium]|nr:class I SAM-dependent methyltransferase [Planctomycetota bacterium]
MTDANGGSDNRFFALSWPLDSYRARMREFNDRKTGGKAYSLWATRYWWIYECMREELAARGNLTIADLGAKSGVLKRFAGDMPGCGWLGLGWGLDDGLLRGMGYDRSVVCDFDQPLPLEDESVDFAAFSHVIEHLPRPEFSMREIARVLRPGGLLAALSPVKPYPVSVLSEKRYERRLKSGKAKRGGHIHAFNAGGWRRLVKKTGLTLEKLGGSYLLRSAKNPLEQYAWWFRLNHLWGALFPSLGNEIFVAARKGDAPRRTGKEA